MKKILICTLFTLLATDSFALPGQSSFTEQILRCFRSVRQLKILHYKDGASDLKKTVGTVVTGTFISPDTLITGAELLVGKNIESVSLSDTEETAKSVLVHPGYIHGALGHNLAIVKFGREEDREFASVGRATSTPLDQIGWVNKDGAVEQTSFAVTLDSLSTLLKQKPVLRDFPEIKTVQDGKLLVSLCPPVGQPTEVDFTTHLANETCDPRNKYSPLMSMHHTHPEIVGVYSGLIDFGYFYAALSRSGDPFQMLLAKKFEHPDVWPLKIATWTPLSTYYNWIWPNMLEDTDSPMHKKGLQLI